MLRHCWIALLLVILSGSAFASATPDFSEANRFYEQGKYTEAIQTYENIIKRGKVSSALFFNLGNAYFKNGELGRAIYNYRRAEALNPRDPDIQANLGFARDRITGSASIRTPAWTRVVNYFRVNELAGASAVALWLLLGLLSVIRWRPALRQPLRPYVLASAVLLLGTLIVLALAYNLSRKPMAIAVQRPVVVHLGPLSESQEAFTVPDGTELLIENRRDGWLQVSDRSNRTGWVEAAKVLTLP